MTPLTFPGRRGALRRRISGGLAAQKAGRTNAARPATAAITVRMIPVVVPSSPADGIHVPSRRMILPITESRQPALPAVSARGLGSSSAACRPRPCDIASFAEGVSQLDDVVLGLLE